VKATPVLAPPYNVANGSVWSRSISDRPPAGIGVASELAAGRVERPFDRLRGRHCASVFLGVPVADLAGRHDQAP